MNKRIMRLTCLSLALMITLSSMLVIKGAFAQPRPKIYIDPANNTFYTNTTSIGATFVINIKAADWPAPGVFSYQMSFKYDNTMLEAVDAEIPDGHWLTPAIKPGNIFVVDSGTIDHAAGTVSFSVTLLSPEEGKVGGGTIAKITLKILAEPTSVEPITSTLGFIEVIMVDPDANAIPPANYDVVAGTFTFSRPPLPKPFLSVSSHAWDNTAADAAGRLFNITVSINNLDEGWHAVGIQFFLSYNKTLIETKSEWISEGGFARYFGGSDPPTFFIAYVEQDVIVGQLQLPPHPGPHGWMNGSGVVATIQFEAIYRPPPKAECDLVLSNIVVADADGNQVQTASPANGKYSILIAPPPWLSLSPQSVEVAKKDDTFDVNVVMNAMDKGFRTVGIEFQVRYDTTLLETSVDAITEGDYMKSFAEAAGTTTFFQAYVEQGSGLIGIIILPLPDGTWPVEVFPEGDGTLATLTFTAIFQLDDEDIYTQLNLTDVLLVDVDAKIVPFDEAKTLEEGICSVKIKKAVEYKPTPPEKSIDLFTQYSNPYGGQGPNAPSDAFAPQGVVKLYANVTYRGEGVPGKPVAYNIRGPKGFEVFGTSFSDENGLALFEFNIPASTAYFGIWNMTASVDIAGEVVTDYVFFRVGWLIEAKNIEILDAGPLVENKYPLLFKGDKYTLKSDLKVITMQSPTKCLQLEGLTPKVILVYSGTDELGQPLFSQTIPVTVGPDTTLTTTEARSDFVLKGVGRTIAMKETSFIVPTSAFSGIAKISANVFTELPWFLGVPYSPAGIKEAWIAVSPKPPELEVSSAKLAVGNLELTVDGTGAVKITISDVLPDENLVGIQFVVKYNSDILELADVIQGDFVKQFGETFFTWYPEADPGVLVGILQLPPWPGENGWMRGSGTIASIEFTAKATGVSILSLTGTIVVDFEATPLKVADLTNGVARVLH